MVCAFGLGPDVTDWLSSHGGSALTSIRKHAELVAAGAGSAGFADVFTTNLKSKSGGRGRVATVFDDPHGKEDEEHADEEGEKKKGMACFPASASVYVKGRGPVAIGELRTGDNLLCGDAATGSLLFSPFVGYMHAEAIKGTDYISVKTLGRGSRLVVSHEHLVFAAESQGAAAYAIPARNLRPGAWLNRVSCDGDMSRACVSEVTVAPKEGQYAPLTMCGTLVVDGTLCSCYADAFQAAPTWLRGLACHEASHYALLPLRLACGLGLQNAVVDSRREGIHPYCRALLALPMAAQALA